MDERLAALTESVELLASLHKDSEKITAELAQQMKRSDKRHTRLGHLVMEIAQDIARLLRVLEAHEQRTTDLEGSKASLRVPGDALKPADQQHLISHRICSKWLPTRR